MSPATAGETAEYERLMAAAAISTSVRLGGLLLAYSITAFLAAEATNVALERGDAAGVARALPLTLISSLTTWALLTYLTDLGDIA